MSSRSRRRIAIAVVTPLVVAGLGLLVSILLPTFSLSARLSRLQKEIENKKVDAAQEDGRTREVKAELSKLAAAFNSDKSEIRPPLDGSKRLKEIDRRLKTLEKEQVNPKLVAEFRRYHSALHEIFAALKEKEIADGKAGFSSRDWLLLGFGTWGLLIATVSFWTAWRARGKAGEVHASLVTRLSQSEDRSHRKTLAMIQEARKEAADGFDRLEEKISGIEEAVRRLQQRSPVEGKTSRFPDSRAQPTDENAWLERQVTRQPSRPEAPGNFTGKVSDLNSFVPLGADEMEFDPVSDMLTIPKGQKQTPGYKVFRDRTGELRVLPAVEKAMAPSEIYWMQPLFDIENAGAGSLNVLRHPSSGRFRIRLPSCGQGIVADWLIEVDPQNVDEVKCEQREWNSVCIFLSRRHRRL